jgi:hypothetical protein
MVYHDWAQPLKNMQAYMASADGICILAAQLICCSWHHCRRLLQGCPRRNQGRDEVLAGGDGLDELSADAVNIFEPTEDSSE